ncbi:diguanylate cyclase (GGDEF)-like protein/PAS domain S-box-containing protein [Pararhizobium capsulatum DSM 1112]|uniref:Diguanylate cyclase (GGDEF)-like protein/PAS domain S-box-containing protein n=1 Tax=Pararhizobium capsulatum DSM 1112 TaxID=1121113 RepID=A0ABU0BME3_9HYPH|nr:EAL domain-containing protein [Pararhizobium capsulatum]MDQ0319424.1 diguanylate cyclase (GGDEF)-like protein/PAS domain S-box-containing protein [Pararhizobium capsulatum DSM 1112]
MTIGTTLRHRVEMLARLARPSLIPVVIAAAVVFTGGYFFDQQNRLNFRSELKIKVQNELSLISTRLQAEITTSITALRGTANSVSANPDMTPEQFNLLASKVLLQNPQMTRISAAPEAVVSMVVPAKGNERMVGTDFKRFGSSRVATDRAQSKARPIIAGPVRLPDGRKGFNLFSPVFAKKLAHMRFWGFMEAIVDETELYQAARLLQTSTSDEREGTDRHIDVKLAIRDVSVSDNIQDPFFGEAEIFAQTPVIRQMHLPGGTWELAAIPVGGWQQEPDNNKGLMIAILAAAAIIIIPIVVTFGLVSERQRTIATLRSRDRELLTLSHRLNLALESSSIGIWEIDLDTQERSWDERMYHLHGLAPGSGHPTYADWRSTVHPDELEGVSLTLFRALDENQEYRSQYRIVMPGGGLRHLRHVGSTHVGADGKAKITGISWDVTDDVTMTDQLRAAKALAEARNTELKDALDGLSEREQQLEEISRRLDLALASYQCGMWEADLEGGVSYWDQRMHQLYGLVFTDGQATHETWLSALHPEDRKEAETNVDRAIQGDLPYVQQSRVVLPDGSVRHVRSVGKIHISPEGARKMIGIAFDISEDVRLTEDLKAAKAVAEVKNDELAEANHRIEHNALHDPLTGLGNRRMLDRKLETLSASRADGLTNIALLHIDLDRFKQINDTLGHAAGDAMLVHASQILRSNIRANDMVARIGGDEFVVVITDAPDKTYLEKLSQRIIHEMRQPVDYNGFPCRFGVSIGIATAGDLAVDERKLLVNADIALYRAKENGRNRFEFFTEMLQAEIITTKRIADEILEGIEKHQFVPWYQPQFEAGTLKLVGVEALIRWNHPREGLLTPDKFLGIAEELNVVATLDRIVLDRALLDAMVWASKGLHIPKISVNVSAKRLSDDLLLNSLQGLSFTAGQLSFELVESIFLDESDDIVTANIEGIKKLGIDIEIDDFGTGHTSIVSLLKIKPKRLKIDRQLVAPILGSRKEQALIRSIIEIGRSLGIETVAEGVETMAHAEMLSVLGCDLLQGYAFSKAKSAEDFLAFAKGDALALAS